MNIKSSINQFLDFCLKLPIHEAETKELLKQLDQLTVLIYLVDFEFDDNDYLDSPSYDTELIATKVRKRFPRLSYYNCVSNISDISTDTEAVIGDAMDDLIDIIVDLKTVLWCYENTSEADALWNFKNSYQCHWGSHLRNLQLYLHSCL